MDTLPICETCGLPYKRSLAAHNATLAHKRQAQLDALYREGWVPLGGGMTTIAARRKITPIPGTVLGLPANAYAGAQFMRLDEAQDLLTVMRPSKAKALLGAAAEAVERMARSDTREPWWRAFWQATATLPALRTREHSSPWWVPSTTVLDRLRREEAEAWLARRPWITAPRRRFWS